MLLILLALWAAILVVGSGPGHFFDGLPLSSAPEALALALLLPLALSRAHRRLASRWLGRRPAPVRFALLGILLGALALAITLVSAGPPSGFLACYRSTLEPPPAGACERSFQNPFFRWTATRVDRRIDFGPRDWNLSFFNSNRFNFSPTMAGHRRRDRLPFAVTWRGLVDDIRPRVVSVGYVGQATIELDGATLLDLPPSYDEERTARTALPPGRHALTVSYTFDDGSRTGDATPVGPYAAFRLRRIVLDGQPVGSVPPAPPPRWRRAAGVAIDVVGIGLSAALGLGYAWLLRREGRAVGSVAAAAVAVTLLLPGVGLSADSGAMLVAWLLLGLVLARNRSARLLLAYFALVGLSAWLVLHANPRLGTVVYRSAGDDWLTYESLARTLLETGSLEGGEPVFYLQPLFRYVRFAERLLLGDGDPLLSILGWTALHWSLLWAAAALRQRRPIRRPRAALFGAAAALTLALAGSAPVVAAIDASLSEHVTWIFLALGCALLSSRRAPRRWPAGAAFLGAALITRPNQAPALLVAVLALLRAAARRGRGPVLLAGAVFGAVCLLPLAHNLYYGGRAVLFTTTATHPATLGVPIGTLAKIPGDATARAKLLGQLGGLLFLPPWSAQLGPERRIVSLAVVLHGLQAAWIAALWLAWRRRVPPDVRLLVLVPALYLAVHIVYGIGVYYPRHILAGYFAMGLVAMAAATETPGRPISPGHITAPE
jgi:hypothetical protein